MLEFLLIGSQALQESCKLTAPDFQTGLAIGAGLIVGLGLYWMLLIAPQLKRIAAFFTPTKKPGPSPASIGVGCMGGALALVLILFATGVLLYVGRPIVLESLACSF